MCYCCLFVCVGLGIASLLIALLVRVLFTFVCVLCAGFNMREKVFIALAWMPKATVQVYVHSFSYLDICKCCFSFGTHKLKIQTPKMFFFPISFKFPLVVMVNVICE